MLIFERGKCTLRQVVSIQAGAVFSSQNRSSEAAEELTELYKRAMKRHLLSDVPVGLLLSGGVDSGLLLALMNLYGTVMADIHGRLRLGVRGRRAGRRRRTRPR